MTTFLLIRHAEHDLLGRVLAGRKPGVHLNPAGKVQAERLARRLATLKIDALYSSPLERAGDTAWPLATSTGLELQIAEEFDEIDFGEWTGKSFDALNADPQWRQFNTKRSISCAPGGEWMLEVQARLVRKLRELHENFSATIAIVSHGDVIKALVAHYAGIPLDLFHRVEISPASLSIVTLDGSEPRILLVNETELRSRFGCAPLTARWKMFASKVKAKFVFVGLDLLSRTKRQLKQAKFPSAAMSRWRSSSSKSVG